MAKYLLKANPDADYLKEVMNLKNAILIPTIVFIVGIVVAFMGYPIAISICCLITIMRSIVYSLKIKLVIIPWIKLYVKIRVFFRYGNGILSWDAATLTAALYSN